MTWQNAIMTRQNAIMKAIIAIITLQILVAIYCHAAIYRATIGNIVVVVVICNCNYQWRSVNVIDPHASEAASSA